MSHLISPEAQVMLAICAFYVYDACVPLAVGAGLLRRQGRTGWQAQLATQGFEVRWAYLAWPPLLVLHQPVYLLRWQPTRIDLPGDTAAVRRLQVHTASFRHFAVPLYGLGATLFALLPAALFVWPSEVAQLVAAGLVYSFAAWIAVRAWHHGRSGHTPRATARAIAVQALLCPPFALNAVRKLSASYPAGTDLLQAANQLLAPPAWRAFAEHVQSVIEADIETAEADGQPLQAQQLGAALQTLQASLAT